MKVLRRCSTGAVALAAVALTSIAATLASWAVSAVPALASEEPLIRLESASDVEPSTATLFAYIATGGLATSYSFEYGTSATYGSSAPLPEGQIEAAEQEARVHVRISGLEPATTYHYRVVASNADGTVEAADRTFTTMPLPTPPPPDTCANVLLRVGPSANLPDCRAYEMVTPVEKNGADVNASSPDEFVVAESGERIEFPTRTAIGDSQGSGFAGFSQYIATRGPGGWSTKGITPNTAVNDPVQFGYLTAPTEVFAFSDELDRAVAMGFNLPNVGVSGAPANTRNFYLEDTEPTSLLEQITRFEGVEEPVQARNWANNIKMGGGSADFGVLTFQSNKNLVPAALGGGTPKVYALDHGSLEPVGILPDGTLPSGGSTLVREISGFMSESALEYKDTVSRDGSRILFLSPATGSERQLYMRKGGTTTVEVSESETAEPAVAHSVYFQGATSDGTKVLFSTPTRLTETDPGGPGQALYLYSDGPHPESEANLTFIARFGMPFEGSRSDEVVKAISEDGSHIYFINNNGEAGLWLWDSGNIQQVAPGPGAPERSVDETPRFSQAWTTPNGRTIAFINTRALTAGTENVTLGSSRTKLYVWDEGAKTLRCASCPQTGGGITMGISMEPAATTFANPAFELPALPRFLSSDGRYVFFNTEEALVPQDTNKVMDAYEYDTVTGKQSLLSTGTGESGTWFVGTGNDGRDAFLVTRQQLTAWDPDKLVDIYDARVGGGLPPPPTPKSPCLGDECQGTPTAAPSFNTASEFVGLGNPIFASPPRPKPRALTRAQQLQRALAKCRRLRRRPRARRSCERAAGRRYRIHNAATRSALAGR